MTVTAANDNEQLVLDFFEVLSSGDLEALRAFYHEHSVWEPKVKGIAGAGRHVGMDIIDTFLAPVRGMFTPGDPKVHLQTMFSSGPFVCVESNSTGTTLDGKVYDNDYCWVFEVADGKIDAMREYMDSHYTAKLFGQAFLAHRDEGAPGSILNYSSPVAYRGRPNTGAYTTIKAGIAGLTKVLAGELGPRGIRVNAIAPGSVPTPATQGFVTPEQYEARAKAIPLRRNGTVADVARAAAFLLSDEAAFINGAMLAVDGGIIAAG